MNQDAVYSALTNHVRNFFSQHETSDFVWTSGPILPKIPRFRVMRVAPGPKSNLWTYISLGAWEANKESKIEFMILARRESHRHVELLAMTAHYHIRHPLGLGHTFPIGEPWQDGSLCDCMLVSLPYPFGAEVEICNIDDGHIHLFWLLPITEAEREFKVQHGLEALEEEFERRRLQYWKTDRASVV